jgi:hypothetical protein
MIELAMIVLTVWVQLGEDLCGEDLGGEAGGDLGGEGLAR